METEIKKSHNVIETITKQCICVIVKIYRFNWICKLQNLLLYRFQMKSFGKKSIIQRPLCITPKYISIGNFVTILPNCRIEGVFEYQGEKYTPLIEIKDGASVQQNLHLTCANSVVIFENTAIAANVTITDIDHTYTDINVPIEKQKLRVTPVSIGKDCKIYNNAVILDGTHIGCHCVIGANSVVKGIFPDYCIIVGVPAKIIKRYNFEKQQWLKTKENGEFIDV